MKKRKIFLIALISSALLTGCTFVVPGTSSDNTTNPTTSENEAPTTSSEEKPSTSDEITSENPTTSEDTVTPPTSEDSLPPPSSEDTVTPPTSDPYVGVSMKEFYSSYEEATSYEDAQYRTKHGFISGKFENCYEIDHNPLENGVNTSGYYTRVTDANYEYLPNGQFKSYNMNYLDGSVKKIYYNAGYVNMDEVATYLLAFGEVPPNNNFSKSKGGKSASVQKWGQHGRVNVGNFTGTGRSDEPALPDNNYQDFIETDFGAHKFSTAAIYNDGHSITRGICRFVFTSFESEPDIQKRRVFFTYNHYHDFQEYLNYYGGWGERFGQESGNGRVTQYPKVTYKSLSEI